MNIIDNREPSTVSFDYLCISEVFEWGDSYWMKIREHTNELNDIVNAVALYDGETGYFANYEKVIKVNAKVIIK